MVCLPVRFDDFSLIEFRWTRSPSTLRFDVPSGLLGASLGDVTLNQFHADFTREFVIPEVKGLRSFLTGSLGATHVAAAHDGFTRFSFGFGAGLKQFLGSRFAIRAPAALAPTFLMMKHCFGAPMPKSIHTPIMSWSISFDSQGRRLNVWRAGKSVTHAS
jgi:hypothetical protein